MKPNYTVLTNVVSPESGEFIGTCWEFFTFLDHAEACFCRHQRAGNVPTMRTFFEDTDRQHMGVVHQHWYNGGRRD